MTECDLVAFGVAGLRTNQDRYVLPVLADELSEGGVLVNKKAEVVRVYLPPDANCLLSVMDHCLRSRHYVNAMIAGKHPARQWTPPPRIPQKGSASGNGPGMTKSPSRTS